MHRVGTLILSLAILPVLVVQAAEASCPATLGSLQTIVIDPGHGGSNEGAVGVADIYERFLTMDTAKRLQTRLAECFPEATVLLTRQNDVDVGLSERTYFANAHQADIFVSLHYNAAVNPGAEGVEVFYLSAEEIVPEPWPDDATRIEPQGAVVESILRDLDQTRQHRRSADLANQLLRALVDRTGAVDRGVRQGRFRVLRGALMPAVVVEMGFLTHPDEGWRVIDPAYTERLVDAMIQGIANFASLSGES